MHTGSHAGCSCCARTAFRHFYADDDDAQSLAQRTMEVSRHANIIKMTPEPYFMLLGFGAQATPREHNDVRPAVLSRPVSRAPGGWDGFAMRDWTYLDRAVTAVRLIKASPAASGKQVYVNVFAPFTLAMQCDDRLVERIQNNEDLESIRNGLRTIIAVTKQYMRDLVSAGVDGFFFSNKCLVSDLGALAEKWILPLDAEVLSELRRNEMPSGHKLDFVLHACGAGIAYERIVRALQSNDVYPAHAAFSWNLEEGGNPNVEHVLRTTNFRIFGTFSRTMLHVDGAVPSPKHQLQASAVCNNEEEDANQLEAFLTGHRKWLEDSGFLHRVVIGPDCCPGAFQGQEMSDARWEGLQRAYQTFGSQIVSPEELWGFVPRENAALADTKPCKQEGRQERRIGTSFAKRRRERKASRQVRKAKTWHPDNMCKIW